MKASLPLPCLCLVTDRRLCNTDAGELEYRVAEAVAGGVDVVQLREKDLPAGQVLELAHRLNRVTSGSALLLINDRLDVALACGADGVQLGEGALPTTAARRVVGEELLIGRSVHSPEGATAAEGEGADFLVVGAVFSTRSHADVIPSGPDLLGRVAAKTDLPLFGIGGISTANVGQVIAAGASGVAVISAILGATDPEEAARKLKEAMADAWTAARGAGSGIGANS